MTTRDPQAQPISTTLEPNFEGGLIHNDWIKGTLFIKITKAQRNAIPALSRSLEGDNATACLVTNDNTIYVLINNPAGDSTSDSDWQAVSQVTGTGIKPIGNWDISNTAPYLQDTDAANINGQFYYVQGAPNEVDITHAGLFNGNTVQVINNDWVQSVGTHWLVIRNTTTWETLNRPQVIIDYENGIVIAHTHEISDVNGLTAILNSKYDDSNLADMVLDYIDVPDAGIANVAFLRKHFYDKSFVYNKSEVDSLLSLLSLGDPTFDGNRAIRKTPVVGENTQTTALGETIDEMFYGFIEPENNLQAFSVEEVGDSVTPQGIGFVDPKDAASITGNILIKDEGDNVGGTVVPDAPPAVSNFNQALNAKTIVAGTNQWYYLEYNYKKLIGDPDTLVTGPSIYLKGVYPFLTGMAATGLTGGGIYAALNKTVVDKGSRAFTINGTNQRIYIAYPVTYGLLQDVVDEAGNSLIGSLFSSSPATLSTQSVGLTINWQVDYYVYESQYDVTATNQIYGVYFDDVESLSDLSLNLDTIPTGIVNVHFTTTHRDKLDGITVPVADIGDMKKSEFTPLLSIPGTAGVVDKSMELVVTGYNTTGSPIVAGTYLKFTGIDAPNFRILIAPADKDANDGVDAFANETIADTETGIIIIQGYNPFIDTTGQAINTKVYLGTAGSVVFTEPTSGSLIEVGRVLLEGNPGLIQGLEYHNLLADNHQADWRANTVYPIHTVIAYTDAFGTLTLVRANADHNSGGSYNPANYDIIAGDMQKSVYDPDGDGIVENAFNQSTTALNDTGVTIARGRLVYLSDFNVGQGFAEIILADKDTPKAANAITDEEILDGEIGRIIITGTVAGISIPVVPLLTPLYLDTLGTFTAVKPLTGLIQVVGRVVYGNAAGAAYFDIGAPTNPIAEDWITGHPYIINESAVAVVDTVGDPPTEIPVIIRCKVAHTSNVLETDWASGYWELVSGDMVSWLYDSAQKKVDVYDMDNMDDGSTNVAMLLTERTKLAGLEDPRYKGLYADPTALRAAHNTANDGDSAGVLSTTTTWIWNSGGTPVPPEVGGSWEDSLIGIGGDMLASVYDPTAKAADAFNMDNFAEGVDTIRRFFDDVRKAKLDAFGAATTYYNKTETDNLLALKAAITYVDNQDALQMTITTYDPTAVGGDVFDMDNMVEGTNLILTAAERAAIISNTSASHTHANKAVLDAITAAGSGIIISVAERADIVSNTAARHTHANKALLDTITDAGAGEAFLADDGNYKEAAKAGIHDGTAIYKQDIFILENGGNVYADVELLGSGDLTVYFGSTAYILDCTTGAGVNGRARVQLTAGTTTVPQNNSIYVYLNVGVATLGAQTDPALIPSEFAWIGVASVRDSANVAIEGPIMLQRFTDAIAHNDRGRLSYLGERLRAEGAKWWTGVDQTVTITPNGGGIDQLDISVLTGIVFQLHQQTYPALDSAVEGVYITKVSGAGALSEYQKVTDLSSVNEYFDGTNISDGDYYNLVIWGSISKETGQCHLFVNPSSGPYGDANSAYNDADSLANMSLPLQFRTVGFLIARIPLRYTAVSSGTLEFINPVGLPEFIDLRGETADIRDESGTGQSTSDINIRGGIYYDSGGVPVTTIAGEIAPATTLFGSAENTSMPAAGRIAVGFACNVTVHVDISSEMSANTTSADVQVAVNGTPVTGAIAYASRGNQVTMNNPSITVPLTLAANDYVSVILTGSPVELYSMTITLKGEV